MQFRKIFLLVMLFAPSAFAKEYTNSQYGLNFTLPESWKIAEVEDLSPKKQEGLKKHYDNHQTLAICGVKDPDKINRSTVLFQYLRFQKTNFRKAKNLMKSEHGKKMTLSIAKRVARDAMDKELKSYREVDTSSYFDNSVPMAYAIVSYRHEEKYAKASYQHEDIPDLICIASKLLVKDGVVTMLCFAQGTETTNFVDAIDDVIASFYYDAYEDENDEDAYEESDRSSRKKIHWLVPTLALCVFVFFLQRWASR